MWVTQQAHLSPQTAYVSWISMPVKISRLVIRLMEADEPALGEGWWGGVGGERRDHPSPERSERTTLWQAIWAYWLFWAEGIWGPADAGRTSQPPPFYLKAGHKIFLDKVPSLYQEDNILITWDSQHWDGSIKMNLTKTILVVYWFPPYNYVPQFTTFRTVKPCSSLLFPQFITLC